MSELPLNQIDVTQLDLRQGQTLVITVKSDIASSEDIQSLVKLFRSFFPKNKVIALSVERGGDIEFTSIGNSDTVVSESVSSCSTGSYCDDCSCGKKEDFLNNSNQGE